MITIKGIEKYLKDPQARKRFELIKKSAEMKKGMSNEELLLKGIQLIVFSKSNLFKLEKN